MRAEGERKGVREDVASIVRCGWEGGSGPRLCGGVHTEGPRSAYGLKKKATIATMAVMARVVLGRGMVGMARDSPFGCSMLAWCVMFARVRPDQLTLYSFHFQLSTSPKLPSRVSFITRKDEKNWAFVEFQEIH